MTALTRLGVAGSGAAYLGFVAKPLSPSCLVPAYREIVFDPRTGLVSIGFELQVFLYDGTDRPADNPDSGSVIFESSQPWAVTHDAIIDAVIARCAEFDIDISPTNVIVHLSPIERG